MKRTLKTVATVALAGFVVASCSSLNKMKRLEKNIAYKVKRTRRSVSLEPMNPYERRIIHSTLQNDKYVFTRSEGEEPFRHVVIALKKEERRERRPRPERKVREPQ